MSALKFSRTPYQNAFMLGPWVPCEVGFHSMPSDPRDLARGSKLQGRNLVHVQNVVCLC